MPRLRQLPEIAEITHMDQPQSEADSDVVPRFSVEPIGFVRSPRVTKVEAERQPSAAQGETARIELLPGRNFEHALEDLASWELIWVIFWFHHNTGWRPKVLPPRSTTGRKGVFATRAPHRPNPLGLSVVRLERIEGLSLHIRDSDMLDGTPVLDLKPYIAYSDAHPGAGTGWLDSADPVPAYVVQFDTLAMEQIDWIETHTGLAIGERIRSTLTLGPEPHPYRRIRRMESDMQLAVKEWRVRFSVTGREVRVTRLESGFRPSQLAACDLDEVRRNHKEFSALWQRGKQA
jgi:tRNA-Thr(GGU) m(6)t(6)A37 methyltransferase TsaA